ncbi:MAG: vWA domain-containing protein [Ferruginibacter sp.]
MKKHTRFIAAGIILFCGFTVLSFRTPSPKKIVKPVSEVNLNKKAHKIQVAILLDVSNSMDGLIEQAKAQLWNMVSVMGKATCDNVAPEIEIALYEYGRSDNDVKVGYVKQLSGFTEDLDKLSQTLFNIKTNGGDEYCGQVMYTSLKNLNWNEDSGNYKVIFIAGNEDFLQGNLRYTMACTEAKKKGVIVNTIYCGDRQTGLQEHWNIMGECGGGSFTNINQDAKRDDIATPYDSVLFSLNEQLNNTYIAYGYAGQASMETQAKVDKMNYSMNKSVAAERVAVKGKKGLYKNEHWDLVDAEDADSTFIAKVDMKTLPDSLQKKSRTELKAIVNAKNMQRNNLQSQIADISIKRQTYINAARANKNNGNNNATLETEIEKIIKQQAKLFNMVIQ